MAGKKKELAKVETIEVITPDNLPLVSADLGVLAFMGRDFELSLVAMTPRILTMTVDQTGKKNGPDDVHMEPSYLATAKVRLGPAAAAQIGGGLLTALKDVDRDAYNAAIKSILGNDSEEAGTDAVH